MQMLVRPAIDAVRDYETYVSKNFISISNSYKLVNEVFENRCAPFQKMGHSRKADLFGWFRNFGHCSFSARVSVRPSCANLLLRWRFA